jgi:hypothetical protein
VSSPEQARAIYRTFPVLARRTARRDPSAAVDRYLLERQGALAVGVAFTVLNAIRGAWGFLALTLVLLAVDVWRIRRARADPDRILSAAGARHDVAMEFRDAPGAIERVMARLADALGLETGQAYTVMLGAAAAIVLMVSGVPAALRAPDGVASAPQLFDDIGAPTSTVPGPLPDAPVAPPALVSRPPATLSEAAGPIPTAEASPPASATLDVVAASWATADPAPLSGTNDATVPDDGLPVEARAGQVSKVSFLRLRGSASTLRLVLTSGPSDSVLVDAAAVLACPITSPSWGPAPGQPLASAPTYDCSRSVDLRREIDGAWTVPLETIPVVGGERNLALVPAGSAGSVFRITFQRPTRT